MDRLHLLVAVAVVLAILSAPAAHALMDLEWDVKDWKCGNNPKRDGVPCLVNNFDWAWAINGEYLYQIYGEPPVSNDPDVSQTVTNYTDKTWTDWHVDIDNGWIVVGSVDVHNLNVPNPGWTISYNLISGYTDRASGFFAEVVAGQGTHVDMFDKLYVFFSYEPDGSENQVFLTQYPTNTAEIPEPASIVGLLAGLGALGFGIRRRAR